MSFLFKKSNLLKLKLIIKERFIPSVLILVVPIIILAAWVAFDLLDVFGVSTQATQAAIGINSRLNYQGKIADSGGTALASGSYNFIFELYDTESGGTMLWSETWSSTSTAGQATVTSGIFSVVLGTSTPLSASLFNSDSLYLQVRFDDDSDGNFDEVFTPRKRLTASPYAFNTDTIDGLHATTTATANQLLALDANKGLTLNSITTTGSLSVDGIATFNSTITGTGFTSAWDNVFNATSTWKYFTPNFDALFNATSTWGNNLTVDGNVTADNLNITNWDTAYSWGNHATAGYLSYPVASSTYLALTDWYATTTWSGNLTVSGSATTTGNLTVANFLYAQSTKLGIGTSTPQATLSVNAPNATDMILHVATSTNQSIFTISNNGNLSVATTTANQRLTIDGAIRLGTTSINEVGSIRWSGVDFEGYTGSSWVSLTGGSWTDAGDYIHPNNYSLFSITDSGYVGIGTTTPSEKLTVATGNVIIPYSYTPTRIATTTLNESGNNGVYYGIYVDNNYLYSAITVTDYLVSIPFIRIMDVKNSYFPSFMGWISNNGLTTPKDICVIDNYAFMIDSGGDILSSIDISNKKLPVFMATTTTNLDNPTGIFCDGDYVFVINYNNDYLTVFDVSTPSSPNLVSYSSSNLDAPNDIKIVGNYAYITSYSNSRLVVFDISNPRAISYVTYTNSGLSNPRGLDVVGNYAYVASDGNNRLVVFDISNPASPTYVGYAGTTYSYPTEVAVSGDYAYVASSAVFSSSGLEVFDVSNPVKPVLVSATQYGFTVNDMEIDKDNLYIANGAEVWIYELNRFKSGGQKIGPMKTQDLWVYNRANFENSLQAGGRFELFKPAQFQDYLSVGGTGYFLESAGVMSTSSDYFFDVYRSSGGAGLLRVGTSTADVMMINSSGLIGVATTTLTERLNIDGGVRVASSTNMNLGTISWNGMDFFGLTDYGWTSLTSSGYDWFRNMSSAYYLGGNIVIGSSTVSSIASLYVEDDLIGDYDSPDLWVGSVEGNIRLGSQDSDGGFQIYTNSAYPHQLVLQGELDPDSADYEMFSVRNVAGAELFSVVKDTTGYANQFYDSLGIGMVGDNATTTGHLDFGLASEGDLFVSGSAEIDGELYVDGAGSNYIGGNIQVGTTTSSFMLNAALSSATANATEQAAANLAMSLSGDDTADTVNYGITLNVTDSGTASTVSSTLFGARSEVSHSGTTWESGSGWATENNYAASAVAGSSGAVTDGSSTRYNYAVYGTAQGNDSGTTTNHGIYGRALSGDSSYGIYGFATSTEGLNSTNYGVYASSSATSTGSDYTAYFYGSGSVSPVIYISNSSSVTTTPSILDDSGAALTEGGLFRDASSRVLKENFETWNNGEVLAKIDDLQLFEYNYIVEDDSIKHFGAMADEWYQFFGLGDDRTISDKDVAMVALAGIQATKDKIDALFEPTDQDSPLRVIDNPDVSIATLSVQQDSNFNGTIYVFGQSGFKSKVVFADDVRVKGKIYLNTQQTGDVMLSAFATTTEVFFGGEFEFIPKVIISPLSDLADRHYWVSDKSTTTFRLNLNIPLDYEARFYWLALPVAGEIISPEETVTPIEETQIVEIEVTPEEFASTTEESLGSGEAGMDELAAPPAGDGFGGEAIIENRQNSEEKPTVAEETEETANQ